METEQPQRLIVSCDECGSPFPAVSDGDGRPLIIGEDVDGCPGCGSDDFSRISL